jgi:hypothetical protein
MSQPVVAPGYVVATTELCSALERALCHHFGAPRRIVKLDRRPASQRSSFAIEEIDAQLDNGTTLQLMFKNVSEQGLLEPARHAKPAFLHDPLREIQTYQTILASNRLSTAICYGAVADPRIGRYWLFLEQVPGLELYAVGFATWERVSRWLAVMHALFAGDTELLRQPTAGRLLDYNGDFYRTWMRRCQACLRQATSAPADALRRIDRLAEHYDSVVERLVALPSTFIHGEFYASNVLVQGTAGALRVCPVDWEMAAVGPGLIDLAALTTGTWNEAEKTALAMAYYDGLVPHGGWPPAPDVFLDSLDYCHLHLAVQWLGWSPVWSPPPEHAQDWLGTALRLAEKVGL